VPANNLNEKKVATSFGSPGVDQGKGKPKEFVGVRRWNESGGGDDQRRVLRYGEETY